MDPPVLVYSDNKLINSMQPTVGTDVRDGEGLSEITLSRNQLLV